MNKPSIEHRPRSRGFSLLELLATLAIIAVVSAAAAPSFQQLIAKYRVAGERSALKGAILTARDTGRNGAAATLCASTNGSTCTTSAWRDGYIVFTDGGAKGVVDGADRILLAGQAAKPNLSIAATDFASGTAFTDTVIQFGTDGVASVTTPVLFTLCQTGVTPQQVVVRRNGNITSPKATGICP